MQNRARKRLSAPITALLVVLPTSLISACSSGPEARNDGVVWLVRHGQYADALEAARRLAQENPENPHVQALYRDTQVAYILDLGRNAVFADDVEEGLSYFYRAYEIDPDNDVVQAWILKTRRQLADTWLDRAAELRGPEQLEEAEEAYERVLTYLPDSTEGLAGLSRVLLLKNYRSGLSKTYFDQGINQFREYWLHPARWNFGVSYRYNRRNEPAKTRREQVDNRLIDERLSQAVELEREGMYSAARNEYRLALLLDPENAAAAHGLDRMDKETRVARSLDRAEMSILRGEYDEAEELLSESEEVTEKQVDTIGQLEAQIEDERVLALYNKARTLERDYKYPEAVEAYDDLLEIAPYYEDAISRKATLEEFVLLAEEYYTRALDAESEEEALEYLRQIPILWPEYRDVEERILELEGDG